MTLVGFGQIALVLLLVAVCAFPLGRYMYVVSNGGRTWLSPVLRPIETGLYRLCGIDPNQPMGWRGYAIGLLVINVLHFVLLYAILRLQYYLPFNPQGMTGLSPRLALNTAMSFVTNTNWQAYSGEQSLSYGAQMFGLTVHNFLSAATGIAAALAVSRAFAGAG